MTPISTRPSIGGDALSGRQRASVVRHRYWEAVLKDQPAVFWPLNEPPGATLVKDWSGHGYDGAVAVGHQTLVFGEPGYTSDGATALQTGGPNDHTHPAAVANTGFSAGVGNTGFTIEAAVGGYAYDDGGNVVGIAASDDGSQGWGFWLNPTSIDFAAWFGDGWQFSLPLNVAETSMHHFVLRYDPATGPAALLDGVPLAFDRVFGDPVVNLTLPGIYVDGLPNLGSDGRMTVADVAIFDSALTAAQIAAHVAAR